MELDYSNGMPHEAARVVTVHVLGEPDFSMRTRDVKTSMCFLTRDRPTLKGMWEAIRLHDNTAPKKLVHEYGVGVVLYFGTLAKLTASEIGFDTAWERFLESGEKQAYLYFADLSGRGAQ